MIPRTSLEKNLHKRRLEVAKFGRQYYARFPIMYIGLAPFDEAWLGQLTGTYAKPAKPMTDTYYLEQASWYLTSAGLLELIEELQDAVIYEDQAVAKLRVDEVLSLYFTVMERKRTKLALEDGNFEHIVEVELSDINHYIFDGTVFTAAQLDLLTRAFPTSNRVFSVAPDGTITQTSNSKEFNEYYLTYLRKIHARYLLNTRYLHKESELNAIYDNECKKQARITGIKYKAPWEIEFNEFEKFQQTRKEWLLANGHINPYKQS